MRFTQGEKVMLLNALKVFLSKYETPEGKAICALSPDLANEAKTKLRKLVDKIESPEEPTKESNAVDLLYRMYPLPCVGTDENNDTCGVTFTCWPCRQNSKIKDVLEGRKP